MEEMIGKKFGKLTVLEFSHRKGSHNYYICECECGNKKAIDIYNIKKGLTKSCGCISRQKRGSIIDKRIYSVLEGMRQRCNNPNSDMYHRYGGRGIKICDEWQKDSRAFIKWAYENGYDENAPRRMCQIDRIDNNKGYSPENCRWVTNKQNSRNMGKCHIVEYKGEKRNWLEWCEILGISKKGVEHCVERYGFTYPQAFDRYTTQRFDVKLQKWVDK